MILRKNRADSLDKILVAEGLVEGRKFDPPILPILPVSLQDLFMVFSLDFFQRFSLYDRHRIVGSLIGLSRPGRAIKDCILCKRHRIAHLFLRKKFQRFFQFVTEFPRVCTRLILESCAAHEQNRPPFLIVVFILNQGTARFFLHSSGKLNHAAIIMGRSIP